ncbi:MAG: anchored repeat-type ABC transporter ATP-binding subunit [Actinomycetaceae bacterium]|nr:anchored repeat-type ABC transporter ATP-binding subunit [Actinomycetaceae bacterium]
MSTQITSLKKSPKERVPMRGGTPGRKTPQALEVRDLYVKLGGRPVLQGVDLAVAQGELMGLVGPNGAGKTTLMRSILGLLKPESGEILVAGMSGKATRHMIGYVPQRHEFAWNFPVDVQGVVLTGRAAMIGLGRRARVEDYAATMRALARVNMSDLATRPVAELSGGQRQRVLIARALATEPAILLLDEPFTGLDVPNQEDLAELFLRLANQGSSLLMSTHDLAQATATCQRLSLINRRVIAVGAPQELRHPEPWIETFRLRRGSPLLKTVGLGDVEVEA